MLAPTVRKAAVLGRGMLNKYYRLMDKSNFYRVAMIMHLGHKMEYFEKEGWPDSWKHKALRLARLEWDTHYKPCASARVATTLNAQDSSGSPSTMSSSKARPHLGRHSAQASMSAISKPDSQPRKDPFEAYLQMGTLPDLKDPLRYWNAILKSKSGSPELAQMALNILSISAAAAALAAQAEEIFESEDEEMHEQGTDGSTESRVCEWYPLYRTCNEAP
ncbi:hypothetical protein LXA43DRAFT_1062869 [Ganoderma leucocontextum]|nr:hypothetical protein LXA43DRAFT_1062869 [Ganoderma leucocontextum]